MGHANDMTAGYDRLTTTSLYHPRMKSGRAYLPAAGHDFFLPFYDPLTTLMGGRRLLRGLLTQAELQPGHAVLDIGCGTGTLAVLIRQAHPAVDVTALDPDPRALARAGRKAAGAGVSVRFDRGFADALEYLDAAFDRVFSSMMFHHLARDVRAKTLVEVRRVLKPGGRLEFLDFAGGTHNAFARRIHGGHLQTAAQDRLLRHMTEAGLVDARPVATRSTFLGSVAYFQASAPR